jgi:Aspartate amino-transferase
VNADTLSACLDAARRDYAALADRGLSLDLTRGKPSVRQLELSAEMLSLPGDRYTSADGTDCRNYYGPPQGLPELREIFSGFLQVPAGQLVAEAGGHAGRGTGFPDLLGQRLRGAPLDRR